MASEGGRGREVDLYGGDGFGFSRMPTRGGVLDQVCNHSRRRPLEEEEGGGGGVVTARPFSRRLFQPRGGFKVLNFREWMM